jgi:DMSO/TMAO reductase YedYZ molybdopterin-dependent catalytic subunit
MKLKKNKIDSTILKKRLFKSISFGIGFFILVVLAFKYIDSGSPKIDGSPAVLRHSFEWNEKVWAKLSSKSRLSVHKQAPTKGELPRVNGEIGLEDELELKNYKVEIESGNKKIFLPISAFHANPKVGYSTDFRCIEGWSEVIQYAGARFSDFIKFYDLGKKADGTYYNYVGLVTPDKKYYVSIDMKSMLHPQTILAYEMNEAPLEEENGAPLRLVIPIKYGIKSLKRIGKIFFSDIRPPDYWAEKGYDWYSGF